MKLDLQYKKLLESLTSQSPLFGTQIKHNMVEGFPLLSSLTIPLSSIATELKWMLKGDNNIKYLVDNNCDLWNNVAYKIYVSDINDIKTQMEGNDTLKKDYSYLIQNQPYSKEEYILKIKEDQPLSNDFSFSQLWGNVGPIYGRQWTHRGVNQMKSLVNNIKDRSSFPLIVSAWNIFDFQYMKIYPNHYSFQCSINNGRLSLLYNQHSVEVIEELPHTLALYGFLLLVLCKETGLKPGALIGNLGDVYINPNNLNLIKNINNQEPINLPQISINNLEIEKYTFDYSIE